MSQILLNINVEEPQWQTALPDIIVIAYNVKNATFEYVSQNADIDILSSEKPLTVNLCLSNDKTVHQLNKEYRNKDKPTNVLTFANMDSADFETDGGVFDEIDLGNIIIAYETMCKEAEIEGITLYAHFCHLLTHGFLHILGFDHIKDEDAEYMEGFEKTILQNLKIANPYQDED
ncbi:MAG: rRNA maturation RNase YbeY [Alphaproteobacteria bacterium]|nr:rRNA maturation RNase YbeY [Alphaproteobacteria bacterium]